MGQSPVKLAAKCDLGATKVVSPVRPEMFITYDKGIPAKIGLTKISRRTKVLVYGKFPNPI